MSYGAINNQNNYVSKYGDSMQGSLDMDNNPISNLPEPTEPTNPVRLQDLGNGILRIGSGTYTGNGNSSRTINLGLKPVAVFLQKAIYEGSFGNNAPELPAMMTEKFGIWYRSSSVDIEYNVGAKITNNGFQVGYAANLDYRTNESGVKYNYVYWYYE